MRLSNGKGGGGGDLVGMQVEKYFLKATVGDRTGNGQGRVSNARIRVLFLLLAKTAADRQDVQDLMAFIIFFAAQSRIDFFRSFKQAFMMPF